MLHQTLSLKPKRDPRCGIVNIFAGSRVPHELPREKVGIIGDQQHVSIQLPRDLRLYLASNVGRLARAWAKKLFSCRVIHAIVDALPPEEVDLGRRAKLLRQLKVDGRMNIDQIRWTDHRDQSEVMQFREQGVECFEVLIAQVSIAAHHIDLKMWPGAERKS